MFGSDKILKVLYEGKLLNLQYAAPGVYVIPQQSSAKPGVYIDLIDLQESSAKPLVVVLSESFAEETVLEGGKIIIYGPKVYDRKLNAYVTIANKVCRIIEGEGKEQKPEEYLQPIYSVPKKKPRLGRKAKKLVKKTLEEIAKEAKKRK